MPAAKLIPVALGLATVAAVALSKPKSASAATPAAGGGGKPNEVPLAIIQRMVDALATGDPAKIRAEADRLSKEGYPVQAADLRKAADAIAKGEAPAVIPVPGGAPIVPPPVPNLPTAPIQPTVTPGSRTVTVQKGEGPYQIAKRLLGPSGANRWPELVNANCPPKRKDSKTGNFTSLNAGEVLRVPASWPVLAAQTTSASTNPAPAVPPATSPPVAAVPAIPPIPQGSPPPVITTTGTTIAAPQRRMVVVLKGEGPYQIAKRVLGPSGANRWPELVAANVPPKKRDPKTGNFTTLNPGEKLLVPESWPSSSAIVFGADPVAPKKLTAGKIALRLYYGKLHPDLLKEWQRREGIEPTGDFGPTSALVLCYRYGFVPPVPNFKTLSQFKNFVGAIQRRAKKDPQRSDEYRHLVNESTKKAASLRA